MIPKLYKNNNFQASSADLLPWPEVYATVKPFLRGFKTVFFSPSPGYHLQSLLLPAQRNDLNGRMGWFDIRGEESSPLFLWAWLWAALPVIVPPPAPRFCDCVCAHCVFRLISLTLSCSDEAGQITLSAQPTQSVQNEEREQRSTVFPTVSLLGWGWCELWLNHSFL